MGGKYAVRTDVAVEDSQSEICKLLQLYGADEVAHGFARDRAMVAFALGGVSVRMAVPMPLPEEFAATPTGKRRSLEQTKRAHQQALRQRWRAIALVLKAKLEAVEVGISTVEREFLSDVLLPGGKTVGQRVGPELHRALADGGELPPLLPPA